MFLVEPFDQNSNKMFIFGRSNNGEDIDHKKLLLLGLYRYQMSDFLDLNQQVKRKLRSLEIKIFALLSTVLMIQQIWIDWTAGLCLVSDSSLQKGHTRKNICSLLL